jgi:predicted porin
MKKTLVAMAVLAASTAAMAQSSVTVYGVMDVWVGGAKEGLNTKTSRVMESGGLAGSRIGFMGEEDLGGGLKAVFKYEQGLNADSGEGGLSAQARQAYVGLAGGFGQVTFGNVWSAMDDVFGASNSGFDSGLSANAIWSVGYKERPTDAIRYESLSYGPVSFVITHGLNRSQPGLNQDQTDVAVMYADGAITANYGYQLQRAAVDTKVNTVNGSYDLGVAKLLASYATENTGAAKATAYQIGADVPLSSALTLSVGYAQNKVKATDAKAKGYSVAVGYGLSKRTTVYAGYRTGTEKTAGVKTDKNSLYAVGINHAF